MPIEATQRFILVAKICRACGEEGDLSTVKRLVEDGATVDGADE